MTKESERMRADALEQTLQAWELPPECEMRAEHAAETALSRIAALDETQDDAEALFAAPFPAEPEEPGYAAAAAELSSRVEKAERPSALRPLSSRSSAPKRIGAWRQPAVLGAMGTVLAAAAIFTLWVRAPEKREAAPRLTVAAEAAPKLEATEPQNVSRVEQDLEPIGPSIEAPKLSAPERSPAVGEAPASKPRFASARPAVPEPRAAPPAAAPPAEDSGPSPRMRPAAQGMNLPDHPSTGEVQASLAKVLPTAQQCLPRGHPPVPTTVSFVSDGRVGRVTPPGNVNAAVQGCVKDALGMARVSPFARLTYGVQTTVRPAR